MANTRQRLSETERAERRARDRERLARAAEQLLSSEGWQRWMRVRSQAGLARLSLHNHCIIKALALTRPGGIVAVLTSRYTLDAQNPAARREINAIADLVALARDPQGLVELRWPSGFWSRVETRP